MKFADRTEAGKILAEQLSTQQFGPETVVLGLPRGGIPVAYEVAEALHLPLDVLIVRKLGFPGHEEFAMGAMASGGTVVLDTQVINRAAIPTDVVNEVIERESQELERREKAYRDGRNRINASGRDIILVDDGLATGSTMRAAVQALRKEAAKSITVAVPVGAPETCTALASESDRIVCVSTPDPFYAVGLWYQDFAQTTDEEVRQFLTRAYNRQPEPAEHLPPRTS